MQSGLRGLSNELSNKGDAQTLAQGFLPSGLAVKKTPLFILSSGKVKKD